jgi:ATP-dependent helicase HepA
MAERILARVPEDLEDLTEEVTLATAEHLDLHVESHREGVRHSVEFGARAKVETLPGVPVGTSYLGTFDREEGVRDEAIDYFASGHPLVEGVMAYLEDSQVGRVGLLHLSGDSGEEGFGLLAIYKDGPTIDAVAIDAGGRSRPDWAQRLIQRPVKSRRIRREAWVAQPGWPKLIRALAQNLDPTRRPVVLAAFRIG